MPRSPISPRGGGAGRSGYHRNSKTRARWRVRKNQLFCLRAECRGEFTEIRNGKKQTSAQLSFPPFIFGDRISAAADSGLCSALVSWLGSGGSSRPTEPLGYRGVHGRWRGGWAYTGRRRRARPVARGTWEARPPARTPQLGGRFPEGVRRQTQVASAARTAVQQVASDVVSALVHPPQRAAPSALGRGGGTHPPRRHHTRRRRQQGVRCAVRCTWDTAGTHVGWGLGHSCSCAGAGVRPAAVRANTSVRRTCQRVPRWCGRGHAIWRGQD
jgi:hypothetical protein